MKTFTMRQYRRDRRLRTVLYFMGKYRITLALMILALPITFLATDKRWKTPLLALALPVFAPITFV